MVLSEKGHITNLLYYFFIKPQNFISMTSRQEAKLSMYDAVLAHCNANGTIVASVPAFETAIDDLEDIVEDIRQASQDELHATGGYTDNKTEQRQILSTITLDVASAIFAFATSNNDLVLKEQVNINSSYLQRQRDEVLGSVCNNILIIGNANAAALIPFGVTAAKLTQLNTAISNYNIAVPGHRNAVSNRVSVKGSMKELFKDADMLLKERADKLAVQFKTAEPDFYYAYKNNRIIIDSPTSNTQVSGTVTILAGGAPLAGVLITVTGQAYTTTTDADGNYTLKIPVPGDYELVFTKSSYVPQTQSNVSLTLGETTDLDISLESLPA